MVVIRGRGRYQGGRGDGRGWESERGRGSDRGKGSKGERNDISIVTSWAMCGVADLPIPPPRRPFCLPVSGGWEGRRRKDWDGKGQKKDVTEREARGKVEIGERRRMG